MRTVGRGRGRTVKQYLVKWKGYGEEHNMWCDEDGVTQAAVDAYHARKGVQNAAGPAPAAAPATRPRRTATRSKRVRSNPSLAVIRYVQ